MIKKSITITVIIILVAILLFTVYNKPNNEGCMCVKDLQTAQEILTQ